ncbi:MAG: Arginine pathway regulatory protein ArgR, repressor of arg regulon, partial [uncultured Rubrobacteraceae bacterium]
GRDTRTGGQDDQAGPDPAAHLRAGTRHPAGRGRGAGRRGDRGGAGHRKPGLGGARGAQGRQPLPGPSARPRFGGDRGAPELRARHRSGQQPGRDPHQGRHGGRRLQRTRQGEGAQNSGHHRRAGHRAGYLARRRGGRRGSRSHRRRLPRQDSPCRERRV